MTSSQQTDCIFDKVSSVWCAEDQLGLCVLELTGNAPGLQVDIAETDGAPEDPDPKADWVGHVVVANHQVEGVSLAKAKVSQKN